MEMINLIDFDFDLHQFPSYYLIELIWMSK